MYYAFAKAKHAVAKDSLKIVRMFHWRKLLKAPDSLQNQFRPRKLAKVTKGNLNYLSSPYLATMYYNLELGLILFCSVLFAPPRDHSPPAPGHIHPPLTLSWTSTRVTCDCLLPFVHPLLSQVFLY